LADILRYTACLSVEGVDFPNYFIRAEKIAIEDDYAINKINKWNKIKRNRKK